MTESGIYPKVEHYNLVMSHLAEYGLSRDLCWWIDLLQRADEKTKCNNESYYQLIKMGLYSGQPESLVFVEKLMVKKKIPMPPELKKNIVEALEKQKPEASAAVEWFTRGSNTENIDKIPYPEREYIRIKRQQWKKIKESAKSGRMFQPPTEWIVVKEFD